MNVLIVIGALKCTEKKNTWIKFWYRKIYKASNLKYV